jgi:hypothetical protein
VSVRAIARLLVVVMACASLAACPNRDDKLVTLDRSTFVSSAHERARESLRRPAVSTAVIRCLDAVRVDDALSAPTKMLAGSFIANPADLMALGALLEPLDRVPAMDALADEIARDHPGATREELRPIVNDLVEQRGAAAARGVPASLWVETLTTLDTSRVAGVLGNKLYDEIEHKHLRALQPLVRGKKHRSPQRASDLVIGRVLAAPRLDAFLVRVFDSARFRTSFAAVIARLLAEPTVQTEIRASIVALAKTKEVPELMLAIYDAVFGGKPAELEVAVRALLTSPHVIAAMNRIIHAALSTDAASELGLDLQAALAADPEIRAAYDQLMRW